MPREKPIILILTSNELSILLDNLKADLKILLDSGAYLDYPEDLHTTVKLLCYFHDKMKGLDYED